MNEGSWIFILLENPLVPKFSWCGGQGLSVVTNSSYGVSMKARIVAKGRWKSFGGVYKGSTRMGDKEVMEVVIHRFRRSRSLRISVFSRIRRERSRSTRQRAKEGGVFKRLGSREKSVSAPSDSYNQHSYLRYTEALSESEDSVGNARIWFNDLSPESIDSYDDLKKAFLENFLQQKKYIKDPIELHNIKQQDRESMKDFVRRYKLESKDVKGVPECMRISRFMHGITNPELIKHLYDKILKTIDEMMRVTTSFLRREVAASNHEWKKSFPP
nr:reverse transcriptase domain-containing protein [Tanacetum cinerariifolium]